MEEKARQLKWMDMKKSGQKAKKIKCGRSFNYGFTIHRTVCVCVCVCVSVCVVSVSERAELCVKFQVSLFLVTLQCLHMTGLELFHFD